MLSFKESVGSRRCSRYWWRSRTDPGGELVQMATIDSAPGDFRGLALQIHEAGLLNRRPGYYSVKIVLTIAAYAGGWAALLIVGNSWATLGVAAFLGVMFT